MFPILYTLNHVQIGAHKPLKLVVTGTTEKVVDANQFILHIRLLDADMNLKHETHVKDCFKTAADAIAAGLNQIFPEVPTAGCRYSMIQGAMFAYV